MPSVLGSMATSAGARARVPPSIACYGCDARREEACRRTRPCNVPHRKLLDAVAHGLLLGVKQGGQRLDERLRRDDFRPEGAAARQTLVRTGHPGQEHSRTRALGAGQSQGVDLSAWWRMSSAATTTLNTLSPKALMTYSCAARARHQTGEEQRGGL